MPRIRFDVYAEGEQKRRVVLIASDVEKLSERIQMVMPNRRPEWKRRPLLVFEYGGTRRWTWDWDERKLTDVG